MCHPVYDQQSEISSVFSKEFFKQFQLNRSPPCWMRYVTTLRWLSAVANQSGMRPLEVSAVVEAPLSTSSFTTFRYPALAAQCIGVQPSCIQGSDSEIHSIILMDHPVQVSIHIRCPQDFVFLSPPFVCLLQLYYKIHPTAITMYRVRQQVINYVL